MIFWYLSLKHQSVCFHVLNNKWLSNGECVIVHILRTLLIQILLIKIHDVFSAQESIFCTRILINNIMVPFTILVSGHGIEIVCLYWVIYMASTTFLQDILTSSMIFRFFFVRNGKLCRGIWFKPDGCRRFHCHCHAHFHYGVTWMLWAMKLIFCKKKTKGIVVRVLTLIICTCFSVWFKLFTEVICKPVNGRGCNCIFWPARSTNINHKIAK